MLRDTRGQNMAEAALTLPLLVLLVLALVNLALLGYSRVAAVTAADYAARVAAVSQDDPIGRAVDAARTVLDRAGVGDYAVTVVADPTPGGVVQVRVRYETPNLIAGLTRAFGVTLPDPLAGEAVSSRYKEGW